MRSNRNDLRKKPQLQAIHKLKRYYDEKHFVKDPDYIVRMDRLLSVIKDHETDEEMDQLLAFLKKIHSGELKDG